MTRRQLRKLLENTVGIKKDFSVYVCEYDHATIKMLDRNMESVDEARKLLTDKGFECVLEDVQKNLDDNKKCINFFIDFSIPKKYRIKTKTYSDIIGELADVVVTRKTPSNDRLFD